jgi:hypothetical protein
MTKNIHSILVAIILFSALGSHAQCDQPNYLDLQSPCGTAVCDIEPLCCEQAWDAICASIAASQSACQSCWSGCYDNDLDGITNCDGDCDDFLSSVNPLAFEVCNGYDDNCDGFADEGTTYIEYFVDEDGDGFGGESLGTSCPTDGVTIGGDCNDTNNTVFPGAIEDCVDGQDNDCDGQVDNTPGACDVEGYTLLDSPCAIAVCELEPLCCSQAWDVICASIAATQQTCASCVCGCYDNDLDGFTSCDGDCNDFDPLIYPGADEVCNFVDDDCNGLTDEGASPMAYYRDADADGYGGEWIGLYCEPQDSLTTIPGDCDDSNPFSYPGAIDFCGNDVDEDCDGLLNNSNTTCDNTNYIDISGPCATAVCSYDPLCCSESWDAICAAEAAADENCQYCWCGCYDYDLDGFTNCDGDCDDFHPEIYPDAIELCNGVDENCDGESEPTDNLLPYFSDLDHDGIGVEYIGAFCAEPANASLVGGDCDDTNASVFPGALEDCLNGIDNDCDGLIDNVSGACDAPGYADLTGPCAQALCSFDPICCSEGWDAVCASEAAMLSDCQYCWCSCFDNDLDGYTNCAGDCDDFNSLIHPNANETCDGWDENCNGIIDDNAPFLLFYLDQDGDGFGDAFLGAACNPPSSNSVSVNGDCNDTDASIYPGAIEDCGNNSDNDCDGFADNVAGSCDAPGYNPNALQHPTCIQDVCAQDTLCCSQVWDAICTSIASATASCAECLCGCYDNDLDGFTNCDGDCNDFDASVYPSAAEVCNALDENCNDFIDEGLILTEYFEDYDGDGYGTNSLGLFCAAPANAALLSGDCDDSLFEISPSTSEICNELDDNCDGQADEGLIFTLFFADSDGDGFGSDTLGLYCFTPPASATQDGDCDDSNSSVSPIQTESCNGIDDDCSGIVDDGLNFVIYYSDADDDGFGDANQSVLLCQETIGFVSDSTDCNDADGNAFPGALEQCNEADDNCNGLIDENVNYSNYYEDIDGDDYGGTFIGYLCIIPPNSTKEPGDCDDNNASISPIQIESCNALDDNCNGQTDEGLATIAYYEDTDGDGYGGVLLGEVCNALIPENTSIEPGDCDDTNNSVSPISNEICDDFDNDCDGLTDEDLNFVLYFSDNDLDGYGTDSLGYFCVVPQNSAVQSGDCNDAVPGIHPGVFDGCNNTDDDCDAIVDEDVTFSNYYLDDDGDGYGTTLIGTLCTQPPNSATNNTDCDDTDSGVHPNAPEFCNATDDDCDGTIDNGLFTQEYFSDVDQDGYGGPSIGQWCYPPPNSANTSTDCDDSNELIYPGSTEVCNTYDDDCDGNIDEGLLLSFFIDADGDGYGNPNQTTLACGPSTGIVTNGEDCDDAQASVYPGNTEILDELDNDCDGVIDNSIEEVDHGPSIRVYPNPACTRVTMETEGLNGNTPYRIINAVGATVVSGVLTPGKRISLDIDSWSTGCYMILVDGALNQPFVKE